jgi:hypothetical protein
MATGRGADDDEYEELLLYVSFKDTGELPLLNSSSKIIISDLMSGKPRCQVRRRDTKVFHFEGQHRINLGTCALFNSDGEGIHKTHKFVDKTIRCVQFELVDVDREKVLNGLVHIYE